MIASTTSISTREKPARRDARRVRRRAARLRKPEKDGTDKLPELKADL
jgi:hypothetical protein